MADDTDIAIKVSHVSKSFKLPHESQNSLKSRLINFNKRGYEIQHALQGISFEVKKGEFFGIVGRNGSGKSTLLKMLAGIYAPNSGNIEVNGKLTPFIELGVGFNPELSGRDNVFLNGALLGFNRQEMYGMYDDIVKFAELERFMDQKLKNYSSGMQVRLAFSIAIRANSDILVLDEVLAVGDANFQKKCFDYFRMLKRSKKTVILVSHDMDSVRKFSDRAMLLDKGKIVATGDPDEVSEAYTQMNIAQEYVHSNDKNKKKQRVSPVEIQSVKLLNGEHKEVNVLKSGDDLTVVVEYKAGNEVSNFNIGIGLHSDDGSYVFGCNTQMDEVTINRKEKTLQLHFDELNLNSGGFYFHVSSFGEDGSVPYVYIERAVSFNVRQAKRDMHYKGAVVLAHQWKGTA